MVEWQDAKLTRLQEHTKVQLHMEPLADINLGTSKIDRDAWRAAIHGLAKSQTWLSDWSDLRAEQLFYNQGCNEWSTWTLQEVEGSHQVRAHTPSLGQRRRRGYHRLGNPPRGGKISVQILGTPALGFNRKMSCFIWFDNQWRFTWICKKLRHCSWRVCTRTAHQQSQHGDSRLKTAWDSGQLVGTTPTLLSSLNWASAPVPLVPVAAAH